MQSRPTWCARAPPGRTLVRGTVGDPSLSRAAPRVNTTLLASSAGATDVLLWVAYFVSLIPQLISCPGRIVWCLRWGCPAENLDRHKYCRQWRGNLLLLIFLEQILLVAIFLLSRVLFLFSFCGKIQKRWIILELCVHFHQPGFFWTLWQVVWGTPLSSSQAGSCIRRGLLYLVNPEPHSNFHVKGSLMSRHYHRPLLRAGADKILEWCHKKPSFSSHLHSMYPFKKVFSGKSLILLKCVIALTSQCLILSFSIQTI